MRTRFQKLLKPIVSSLVAIALFVTLWIGQPTPADAASYGGRMGGGSFRSAPRSYSAPRSGGGYSRGGGGYGGGMGGNFFFFPSPWMFFAGGGLGGGFFSLMIFVAVAGAAVQAFQRYQGEDGSLDFGVNNNPKVSVAKLQVGLLAEAKTLQEDLNRIAQKANTGSSAGLTQALQETTLSLLRHPEYWAYAGGESKQSPLLSAESEFNRMILSERSKFLGESVSNVSGQLKQVGGEALTVSPSGELLEQSSEYIVVTVLVGAQGKVELPEINNASDLRRALSTLGAVSSDRLLTMEVLWQPGTVDGVLTSDDMLEYYPKLKLV